jgi:hypothetical protein
MGFGARRDFESALRDSQIVADPNKHLTNVRSITTAKSVREKLLTTGAGEVYASICVADKCRCQATRLARSCFLFQVPFLNILSSLRVSALGDLVISSCNCSQ